VKIIPTLWKRGSGDRFDAPALTFSNLPAQGTIRILTLAGERVADLSFLPGNAGTVTWNGANHAGRAAASGVYFAYIKSSTGATAVLKLAIER
jgi:hypothetical protein